MSVPESGKTDTDVKPLREAMWIGILGIGSVTAMWLIFEMNEIQPVESSFVEMRKVLVSLSSEAVINIAARAKYFIVLDARKAFHQCPLVLEAQN